MRQTGIYLSLLLLAMTFIIGASADANLRVGPIYADKLPKLQVVFEQPGRLAESATMPLPQEVMLIEDGKATVTADAVSRFGDTGRGIAIVVAVDISRSMKGEPLGSIKRALLAIVDNVGPQDRVAVVSFADEWKLESRFNDPRDTLRAAIKALTASGNHTRLNTALYKSLALLDAQELPARKRLLVISDGHDEQSSFTQDDVIDESQKRRVPIDAIGFTQDDRRFLGDLERFASKSGGNYLEAATADDLSSILQQGIERLQSTPVASFTAQNLRGDDQKHAVGVRLSASGQMAGEDEAQLVLLRTETEVLRPADESKPPQKKGALSWIWLAAAGALLLFALLVALGAMKRKQMSAGSPRLEAAQREVPQTRIPSAFYATSHMNPELESNSAGRLTKDDSIVPAAIGQREPSALKPQRRNTQIRTEFAPPTAGHPSAVLAIEDGPVRGSLFPIESESFWIGAEPDNSLFVDDDHLSGYHACIQFHEGSLFLHDNNSTNGTFVNGERVQQMPRPLTVGDRIRVGASVLLLMASDGR